MLVWGFVRPCWLNTLAGERLQVGKSAGRGKSGVSGESEKGSVVPAGLLLLRDTNPSTVREKHSNRAGLFSGVPAGLGSGMCFLGLVLDPADVGERGAIVFAGAQAKKPMPPKKEAQCFVALRFRWSMKKGTWS